ncbi:MAG: two-component regulator propeller domain-containing protein [Bacteroidota bacterium]
MNISPLALFLLGLFCLSACFGQGVTSADEASFSPPPPPSTEYVDPFKDLNTEAQLMLVVRHVFEDSRNWLWVIGDDVIYHNGEAVMDLSEQDFFRKQVTRRVAEDPKGILWFATSNGIVSFDPTAEPAAAFQRFTTSEGLVHPDVWSLFFDRAGIFWVGTLGGTCRFDGESFALVDLPETEPDHDRGVTSEHIVHSIRQDRAGKMWFASNEGAFILYGDQLDQLSVEGGMSHRVLNDMLEDQQGNVWFTTHHAGVCRWDGENFVRIGEADGVEGSESWSLYEDREGNIWFPIENQGIYRFDGKSFRRFYKADGLPMGAVHSIVEDHSGQYWLGGFGGLYHFDGEAFVNVVEGADWPR